MGRGDDPTKVTAQPALTSSSGRVWLIVGAVFCIVALVVLGLQLALQPVIPIIGMTIAVLAYAAIVVVRFSVPAGQRRLYAMAVLFGIMVASTLVCVLLVAASVAPSGG